MSTRMNVGNSTVRQRFLPHAEAVRGTRGVLWSIALAALMLHPYATVLLLDRTTQQRLEVAGLLSTLLADVMLLAGALILTLDARLTQSGLRAAMATSAALVAAQDAPMALLSLADRALGPHTYRLSIGHLLTVLVVVWVIDRGKRRESAALRAPFLQGLLLGIALLGASLGVHVVADTPLLMLDEPGDVAVAILIGLTLAAIHVQLSRTDLPRWASTRLGLGMGAIFAARVTSTVLDAATPPPAAIALVALFSALITTTATSLFLCSLGEVNQHAQDSARRAAEAEAEVTHDREVAPDLQVATASIIAGVRLLTAGGLTSDPQRRALTRMISSEAERLGRALSADSTIAGEIDLDALLRPLVVAHLALGHDLTWVPGGLRALGRSDDVSEAVSVLLNHSRLHPRSITTLSTVAADDRVHLDVLDHGADPDVVLPPGLARGLQRARRLLREQDGTLEAVEGGYRITLPVAIGAAAA